MSGYLHLSVAATLMLACACQSPASVFRTGPMRADGKPAGLGGSMRLRNDLANGATDPGRIDFGFPSVEMMDGMRWLGASVTDPADLRTLAPPEPARERVSDLTFVKAPPLRSLRTTGTDIGIWDDAYAVANDDAFVLRRGDDLYALPANGASVPTRLCSVPGTANLRIVHGATFGKRLWLFCHPESGTPGTACAIDGRTGVKVDFVIPGMDASETAGPQMNSWAVLPHVGGAVIYVSGGQVKAWPRDGKRPLFYWFDLRSGRVRQMPTGWDLDFFSADQKTAVFATDRMQPDGRRILAGVSMRTGQDSPEIPDRGRVHWISWSPLSTSRVQPVAAPRVPGEGDTSHLAGLSLGGSWYPFKLPGIDSRECYMWSLDERDGRVVFRAISASQTPVNPMVPCYTFALKQSNACLELDSSTTDCALTGEQTGVFAATGFGPKGDSEEAFAFDARTKQAWNLLDGVERLPALSADNGSKSYIRDRMSVRMVRGTGNARHPGLVLCSYSHGQGDLRANLPGPGEVPVPFRQWNHSVLAGPGWRYETGLFREGLPPPSDMWLLNCGKIVYAGWEARADASGKSHVKRFHVVDLGIAPQPKRPK